MEVIDILETTTIDNFDEESYLLCNRDVYQSLSKGQIESGKYHFINNGQKENRLQLRIDVVKKLKNYKLAIIKNLLKEDYNQNQYLQNIAYSSNINIYNFLDENTKKDFHIVDTENVSQHSYDAISLKLIEYYQNGNILDFGAGFRRLNYKNVINYEIVQYASTDVLGVGEKLPFKDSSFDCIFSFAVLEHVQDPFACAKEIMRCLKPGGLLYTVVPHLQPYHGYPHHYYNMTHQGLANLFPDLQTLHQEVNYGNTVIWSISWILQRWNSCLSIDLQERFLDLKVADLISPTLDFLEQHEELVNSILPSIQMEIAAATSLIATKKPQGNLAAQQVKNCQLALTQIKEKLQPCYIDEAQFNLNLAEFIHEESEQKTSMSDMEHSAKKSVTQKIEHVLRTTLHYFRIWKRDVFEFK